MKSWYQIDKRTATGELITYEMVKANNRITALKQYLGENVNFVGLNQSADNKNDYILVETVKNGKYVYNARTLHDKSFYVEVTRVNEQ